MSGGRGVAIVLAATALSGCVTTTTYQAKVPAASGNCVSRLEMAPHQALLAAPTDPKLRDKLPYVEFADVAQCLQAAEGNTVLTVYSIDEGTRPAQIDISLMPSPGGTFAAAAELLDGQFNRLERHPFNDFTRRGGEYSLSLFLNHAGPAYLVLMPDQAQVGKRETMIGSANNPMVVPSGPVMFMVNNGSETKVIRTFMAGGRLKVLLKPQSNAAFSPQ